MVVGRRNGIALLVGKLELYQIMPMTELVQDRRSDAAEAVSGHARVISHAVEREEQSVVAHWLRVVALAREHEFAA